MAVRLWKSYIDFVAKYPLKSQAYSSGVLFFIGDVVAQQVVERKGSNHNPYRTVRQTVFGLVIAGPALRGWYVLLDKIYKTSRPQTAALKKMVTDQIIMAPLFIFTFFTVMGCASGKSLQKIKDKVRQDYFDTVIANYKVWPAFQLINFYFIPLQHRVLFVNTVALFWNTYLAWKTNIDIAPQDKVSPDGQMILD
ncbi:mitochondrial inner membrane protein Mpv17-like [Saccoglossus kowalevskii]|uniref:Mitochondrial inner membrane protein Mpv17 n=1 Tax=Saccoglossus kowalevskii TaxID=10224 RepID=A0ABM0M425_SACKO|nr:PREDICTED: protein Mpv17-like [Saccoglossus kowalevskii]